MLIANCQSFSFPVSMNILEHKAKQESNNLFPQRGQTENSAKDIMKRDFLENLLHFQLPACVL